MAEAVRTPPRALLEMRGIGKRFGATVALDGVSLSVASGEVCGLVGENGAGKSTLMAILAGAVRPDDGIMAIDGVVYTPRSPIEARRAGVAMIYQELSLAPHLSVMDNILLGVEPTTLGWLQRGRMAETARRALAELGHGDLPPETLVGALSVPMQQIVEIARAVAVGCRVLVLDEPTSSLGREDTRRLFALLTKLRGQGHAIVYISHFIEEVKEIADRFVVLRDGRNAGGGTTADATHDGIVGMMIGGSARALFPRTARTPGEAVLTVDGLQPGDASLTLRRGEVFGIAGLIGAGRTRLLRSIFGLEPVRSGTVRVGVYSGGATPHRRWEQGVGMLSEDRKHEGLAPTMSIADNLTITNLRPFGSAGLISTERQRNAARQWIGKLAIRCAGAGQPVAELSGGNQQKVALARLLYHDVDVLILDEPTRGIDVSSKAQIYGLIDALVSEAASPAPKAVLLVSSYLPELLGVADRVAVMFRGRLQPARPVAELTESSLMVATMTGGGGDRMTARALLDRTGALIGLVIVTLIFTMLVGGQFIAPGNLELMARQTAIVCMAAIGMTAVIVAGGIDLSVGSVISLTTVVIAVLLRDGASPAVAALGGLAAAAACGLVNGLLITRLRVVPFIVTLGTMLVVRGVAKGVADERRVEAPITWVNELLRSPVGSLSLPTGIWMVVAAGLAVSIILQRMRLGRHVFAVGSNERMARLCGVPIDRTKVIVYTLNAALAGLAGLLQFSRLAVGDPTVAVGLELDVIAAVIIGGGSLLGGRGNIVGTVIGAAIMTVIQVGCSQQGLANWVQQIVTGGIIVVAVAIDRVRSTRV